MVLPKNRNYDKKIFRLWAILNKLDAGKKAYSSKLAKEFNVSIRSIQRDIELLNMVGFPVEPVERGCYRFVEGFSLGRVMLSEEEASLIAFFYDISKSLGTKFEESFGGFLRKVLSSDHCSPYYLKIYDGLKLRREFSFADTLANAIEENQYITINYLSTKKGPKIKEYKCQPFKIIYYEGFWYLLARCDGETVFRKFRLDKMQKVEELEEYFRTPENLKTVLDESINVWFEGERNKRVVLEIFNEVAEFFKKRHYFPKQQIVKERKNGNIVVESYVSDDMEIIPTVLSWIPWIEVVSPKSIKEKLHKRLRTYLAK